MLKNWDQEYLKKVINPPNLPEKIKEIRRKNKKIVTLNGSFDLLHAGHLHIIYSASILADILIVALNSDASIKRYKSEKRPIVPLKYRMQMMAALEFVSFVTFFEEDDPRSILDVIKPDIHVNGKEYTEDCIEAKVVKSYGGVIHLVDIVKGLSTSSIIEKIKTCG